MTEIRPSWAQPELTYRTTADNPVHGLTDIRTYYREVKVKGFAATFTQDVVTYDDGSVTPGPVGVVVNSEGAADDLEEFTRAVDLTAREIRSLDLQESLQEAES